MKKETNHGQRFILMFKVENIVSPLHILSRERKKPNSYVNLEFFANDQLRFLQLISYLVCTIKYLWVRDWIIKFCFLPEKQICEKQ